MLELAIAILLAAAASAAAYPDAQNDTYRLTVTPGTRFELERDPSEATVLVERGGRRFAFSPNAAVELVLDAATVPIYLELDGDYFSVPAGTLFEYVPGSWVVPATSMTACGRRNGQVQQFSSFSLLYGPNLDIVYLSTAEASSSYTCAGTSAHEACVLAMRSTTDDIVCGGAVAAPDPLFANSFDSP